MQTGFFRARAGAENNCITLQRRESPAHVFVPVCFDSIRLASRILYGVACRARSIDDIAGRGPDGWKVVDFSSRDGVACSNSPIEVS